MKEETKKDEESGGTTITSGDANAIFETVVDAYGLTGIQIDPILDPTTHLVSWRISGDIGSLMEKIHSNAPIGCLDVLTAIRRTKDLIRSFKSNGGRTAKAK